MIVRYLDAEHRLPQDRVDEIVRALQLMINAEPREARQLLLSATKDDDPVVRAFGMHCLGEVDHLLGCFSLARRRYQRAAKLFKETDHERCYVFNRMRLAEVCILQAESYRDSVAEPGGDIKEFGKTRAILDEAISQAQALSDDFLIGIGLQCSSQLKALERDYQAASELAQQSVLYLAAVGEEVASLTSLSLLAQAIAQLGDLDFAMELAEDVFRRQIECNLRMPCKATLGVISGINSLRRPAWDDSLSSMNSAIEAIDGTARITSGIPQDELEVFAHAEEISSPLTEWVNRAKSRKPVIDPTVTRSRNVGPPVRADVSPFEITLERINRAL
ncbi:hypothetical protein ACFV2N_48565 [Streptomyces sp. NPDC059680]|uniref:hypothetical protein n=1 Tax=Streptomyces sp. NPDC059680 TaxID=3346904 RepID=UPI0036A129DE